MSQEIIKTVGLNALIAGSASTVAYFATAATVKTTKPTSPFSVIAPLTAMALSAAAAGYVTKQRVIEDGCADCSLRSYGGSIFAGVAIGIITFVAASYCSSSSSSSSTSGGSSSSASGCNFK